MRDPVHWTWFSKILLHSWSHKQYVGISTVVMETASQQWLAMWQHHLFSAPTPLRGTEEGKSQVRSPLAWVMPRGGKFTLGWISQRESMGFVNFSIFPPFCKCILSQKQKDSFKPTSPPPHTYHLIVYQRKLHPSGLGKLCYTHFAYILYITQGAGWRRQLCCAYLFWLLFMQVWLNEGTVGIISISDVNIKLLI